MSSTNPNEQMLWEDGLGHMTEPRTRLSGDQMRYAVAVSRVGKSALVEELKELRVRYDQAIAQGVGEAELHQLGEEIDIHHFASLIATETHFESPPAA